MALTDEQRIQIVRWVAGASVVSTGGGCTTELDLTPVSDRIDAADGTSTVGERSAGETRITSTLAVIETMLEPA